MHGRGFVTGCSDVRVYDPVLRHYTTHHKVIIGYDAPSGAHLTLSHVKMDVDCRSALEVGPQTVYMSRASPTNAMLAGDYLYAADRVSSRLGIGEFLGLLALALIGVGLRGRKAGAPTTM